MIVGQDHGDPELEFTCDEYTFQVTLKFPINMKPEVVLIDGQDKRFESLTERQKEIFKTLAQLDEAKASEIQENLSKNVSERILRYDLSILKKHGLISSKGVTKNTIWFINK